MDKLKTFDNGLLECKPLKLANVNITHFTTKRFYDSLESFNKTITTMYYKISSFENTILQKCFAFNQSIDQLKTNLICVDSENLNKSYSFNDIETFNETLKLSYNGLTPEEDAIERQMYNIILYASFLVLIGGSIISMLTCTENIFPCLASEDDSCSEDEYKQVGFSRC